MQSLQSENEQLKSALKRSTNEGNASYLQDRYHKALKQISNLLKTNNELRAELEYMRDS